MNDYLVIKDLYRSFGSVLALDGLSMHVPRHSVAAFVGANMLQSSFTGFCLMANILKKFGIKPGRAYE